MRIEQLALERYGIFEDRTLSFDPDATLHVVHGPNEAGKTSALSAIGDLLFGFGARTDYDFRHDSKQLRIGGAFRHSDGRLISARRRKGNKNTLLDADDQPLPDDPFAALLGGISRTAFDREFGMTAPALRLGGDELLSAGGRLAETLAASSAGMAELSRIKDRLQQQADELFTARKSAGKPFYLAAERRELADRALRDAVVTPAALRQLQASVQQAAAQLEQLKLAHAASGSNMARWQRTLRVRTPLMRLDGIEAELALLADLPDVTEQMVAEWRRVLGEQAAREAEIATLDAAATAEAADVEAIDVDDGVLAEAATIEALRERLGAVRKAAGDLPRRRHDRDTAKATLDDLARRLGLASHAELLARLPTDSALAEARDRIEQSRRDAHALADIAARHARAQREFEEFAAQAPDAQHVADIEPLRQRFAALGDITGLEDRLQHERAARAVEREALADALAALHPAPGEPERLRALPLPDRATIAQFAHQIALGAAELTRLDQTIAALDATIDSTESELARLSSSGAVPTRTDLTNARRVRDERLDALRAGLDRDPAIRAARLAEVTDASQAIDGITDLLLTDTGRATRQEDAQRRLAETRAAATRERDKLAKRRGEMAAIDDAWKQAWSASGLRPLASADMLRWRERVDDIVARLERYELQRAGIDALAEALDAGKAATIGFLQSVDRQPDQAMPAGILYREAKARFDQLVAAWSDAKARAVALARLERDLAEADDARLQLRSRVESVQPHWAQAMIAVGLPSDATPVQAEAALAVWNAVGVPRASFEREGRSADTIIGDLRDFESDVAALRDRVAPDLHELAPQDALLRITERLADARRGAEARRQVELSAAKRAASRSALVARLTADAGILDNACRMLGIDAAAALPEPVARLEVRLALQAEQIELRRHLLEIADGHDEHALRLERAGLDLDRLAADIAGETARQEQLLKEIADVSAIHHQQQRELQTLTAGRDAAGAATRRVAAGADMLSIAEDWLLRSAASLLARRAIELHRAKVQDPMISRAGVLFALATADAYAGLGIDYGDEDQPTLVARRADGERVPVSGLSEGTRDQLFLALRLALLERRTSEPMPFIGDDLLASFDERRVLATLRLLAAAGQHRQVILFTHHRHVADLAESLADSRVDLIGL